MSFDNQFLFIPGRNSILISAPHTYSHLRSGFTVSHPKPKEFGIYKLIKEVAHHTKSFAIIANSSQSKDPNWDGDSPFRQFLLKIVSDQAIKTVLDLHGHSDVDEDLWIYPNKFFPQSLKDVITASNPHLKIKFKQFRENNQQTICEELENRGVAALELEIPRHMRTREGQPLLKSFLLTMIPLFL
jgi:hypothetical protein